MPNGLLRARAASENGFGFCPPQNPPAPRLCFGAQGSQRSNLGAESRGIYHKGPVPPREPAQGRWGARECKFHAIRLFLCDLTSNGPRAESLSLCRNVPMYNHNSHGILESTDPGLLLCSDLACERRAGGFRFVLFFSASLTKGISTHNDAKYTIMRRA